MVDPANISGDPHKDVRSRKTNWYAWIALGLGVLALMFYVAQRVDNASNGATSRQPIPAAPAPVTPSGTTTST